MTLRRLFVRARACSVAATFVVAAANLLLAQGIPFVNQPLVPSSVPPGSAAFVLTVNGAQFLPSSVVNWNRVPLRTTYVSAHQLTAVVPASDVASASTASVTVSNPAPGGGTSNAVPFSITTPTATIAFKTSTVAVGPQPGGIAVADFNNDGIDDLAVVNTQYQTGSPCTASVSILLGKGKGAFSTGAPLCLSAYDGYASPTILAGDFNGDGNADLMVVYGAIYAVGPVLFLGNGDGTFGAGSGVGLPTDAIYSQLTGDFNRDGNLDLAVNGYQDEAPQYLFTLLGNGDGTFEVGANPWNLAQEFYGCTMATGDFNNDGILDLALCAQAAPNALNTGQLLILLGNGDGSFTAAPKQPLVTLGNNSVIAAGDFTGEGILDLAIADPTSTFFTFLRGNGDGTFSLVGGQPALPTPPSSVIAADINGDGALDLVFSSSGCTTCTNTADTLSVLLGNGDGTFRAGLAEAIDTAPNGVAAGDFNGDGRMDLAVVSAEENAVSILLQQPAAAGATVTLAASQNPVPSNQKVVYTAVVFGSPATPTGSITFRQGATVLGTATLTNGLARLTTIFGTQGIYPVVASYSGDSNYHGKSSPVLDQVVGKYPTMGEVSVGPGPSVYGQTVTLYYTFFAGDNPTGTVTFRNGTAFLGTAPVEDSGPSYATLTTSNLPAGTLTITGTYNGDAANGKSFAVTTQVVSQAVTTTTLTSSLNPSNLGHHVKFTAAVTSPTVSPVHTGTVTFMAGTTTLGTVAVEGGKASLGTSALPAGTTTITATYNGTSDIGGSSTSVAQTVN